VGTETKIGLLLTQGHSVRVSESRAQGRMVTKVKRTKVNLQKLVASFTSWAEPGPTRAGTAQRDHADGLALELRHLRSPFELRTPTAAGEVLALPEAQAAGRAGVAAFRRRRSVCRRRRKKTAGASNDPPRARPPVACRPLQAFVQIRRQRRICCQPRRGCREKPSSVSSGMGFFRPAIEGGKNRTGCHTQNFFAPANLIFMQVH